MTTNIERIYIFLRERPGEWFDDDTLSETLEIKPRQQVNQICNRLANEGKIIRRRIEGKLRNSFETGLDKPPLRTRLIDMIEIPSIKLNWSRWFPWKDFEIDLRYSSEGVRVPDVPGVYEAKDKDSEERLTIGKASNLRMRVKQGLVKGKLPHSAGRKIRESEDLSKIVVRWAETDRPSCVEEELHKRYLLKFGRLPKYILRT